MWGELCCALHLTSVLECDLMSSGHLPGAGQPLVASRASMAIAHGCQHPSEASWDERTGMGQAGETPWVAGLGAALTALWSLLCQPRAASPGSVFVPPVQVWRCLRVPAPCSACAGWGELLHETEWLVAIQAAGSARCCCCCE